MVQVELVQMEVLILQQWLAQVIQEMEQKQVVLCLSIRQMEP
jgi:hypothetical protein